MQTKRKAYRDEVNRTESSGLNPILFTKAAGSRKDLPETYRPALYAGKSKADLPKEVHWAAAAYVPSSDPKLLDTFGNAKNATTLTTNEAKTIAYNLLFKVVSRRLESFIVKFYRILDLWKFKNEREAVGPRWP